MVKAYAEQFGITKLKIVTLGVKLLFDLPTEQEQKQENQMINASLNSKNIESLGWKGIFSVEKGFRHTYNILKELSSAR